MTTSSSSATDTAVLAAAAAAGAAGGGAAVPLTVLLAQLSTCDWIQARGWFFPHRGHRAKDDPCGVRKPAPAEDDADDVGGVVL